MHVHKRNHTCQHSFNINYQLLKTDSPKIEELHFHTINTIKETHPGFYHGNERGGNSWFIHLWPKPGKSARSTFAHIYGVLLLSAIKMSTNPTQTNIITYD